MTVLIYDHGNAYLKLGYQNCRRYGWILPNRKDSFESLFSEVNALSDSRILIVQSVNHVKRQRELLAEYMFEQLGLQGINFTLEAVLSLYAKGLSTGLVVDLGQNGTNAVPIYNGYSLQYSIRRMNVAGRNLNEYLVKLLNQKGYNLHHQTDIDDIESIKKQSCYVGYNIDEERRLAVETTALNQICRISDGRSVLIGHERFQVPEILFHPEIVEIESETVAELVFNTIQSTDMDVRPGLYENIVLIGGISRLPGLSTRLGIELDRIYSRRILKDPLRKCRFEFNLDKKTRDPDQVFKGASILADVLANTPEFWISRHEWDEGGVNSLTRFNK